MILSLKASIPLRLIIFGVLCLASMVSFMSRGSMSIIILAMTHPLYNATSDVPNYGKRFHWSAYEQSLVIGSYFWGHILVTFFAGIFAEKYGPRKIAGIAFIMGAFTTVMQPIAAEYVWIIVTIRVFLGLSMGAIPPSLQAAISNWAPPHEMGKFQSVFMAGGIGTVLDWCMSGFIIEHLGWTYAFYVSSILLALVSIAWLSVVYDSPSNHPKISTAEREYIQSSKITKSKKSWPPFKLIFFSIPVWALVCFHFGILYTTYTFVTSAPKYFSDVHHLNITTVGVLSSIPHLLRFPFSFLFGAFGDYVLKRKMMSVGVARKLFSIITHFLPAGFIVGLTLFAHQPYVSVTFMTISLGLSGAVSITSIGNTNDLSPNFATTIFSWMQCIGATAGFIVPLVVTHFTEERSSHEEWCYVFIVGAVVSIGSAIIFILFGSGDVQQWDNVEEVQNGTLKGVKDARVCQSTPNNVNLSMEDTKL